MAQIVILNGTSRGMLRSIGAYQIANSLRNVGYTVQVIEYFPIIANYSLEILLQILDNHVDENTLWVGFSSTFLVLDDNVPIWVQNNDYSSQFVGSAQLQTIKNFISKKNSKCKFVLGGARPSQVPAWDFINYFIIGYADQTAIDLTKYLQGKNPFMQFVENKNGSRSVVYDKKGSLFNFTEGVFRWHESDHIRSGESLPIEISRGCIFRCAFCAYPLNGKKKLDFIKDSKILRDELTYNYEKYKITDYIFVDDTHNDSVEKLEILYNEVYSKLDFKINFSAYLRLDLLRSHPETIELLKESGLKSCFFGIESLNYETNKTVGKGIKINNALETLTILKDKWTDIYKQAGFIIGLPNDSEDTINEWLTTISDSTFPVDHVNVGALYISNSKGKIWKNKFEENLEKYGYTFTGPDNWINNKGLSRDQAIKIANAFPVKNNGSWMYRHALNAMHLDSDQFNKKVRNKEIKTHIENIVLDYAKKLL
jgi:hypothetical protein